MIKTSRNKKFQRAMLNNKIEQCSACPGLNIPQVTPSAPAYGSLNSPIMLVGQSLHAWNPETPTQIPFLGPAMKYDSGSLLIEAIEEAGLKYSNIFITNAVHCHPPKNRASRENEMRNCRRYLECEIRLLRPCYILALGRSAKIQLGSIGLRVDNERANMLGMHSIMCRKRIEVGWIYHPSYLLRNGNQEETELWKKSLRKILDKAFFRN